MDPDDAFEDDPCDQCETTSYYLVDGLAVCSNGHEQSREVFETDDADNIGRGRVVKRKIEKRKTKISRIYRGSRAFSLFLQAYQFILWKQCYALIHDKKLPAELWEIVRSLWALRLPKWVPRLQTGAASEPELSEESGREDEAPTPTKLDLDPARTPRLVETIGLCYMGMLLLRLPVSLGDIYRWIKEEDVTFVRAIHSVPMEMKEKLPGEYHKVLDTTTMIQPDGLGPAVARLAMMYKQSFGLTLPPLNQDLLLNKFISQLAVPLDIFPAVQTLAKVARLSFRYPASRSPRLRQASFPELQLMALIVLAVKLIHPLDKLPRKPDSQSEPAGQKMDWDAWAQLHSPKPKHDDAGLPRGSEIDIKDVDVFDLNTSQIDAYMDWYQRTWVPPPRSDAENQVSQEILDMFPLLELDDRRERPSLDHENEREVEIFERMKSATSNMQLQPLTSDEQDTAIKIKRPGMDYAVYKDETSLHGAAKTFHRVAADVASASVKNLLLAVFQVEVRICKWKAARYRADLTDEAVDFDDEVVIGSGPGGGDDEGLADIGQDSPPGLDSGEFDEDLQMI